MDTKKYTEVLIDGRIYTLGGYEDEAYMQRVAGYINEMITTLRRQEGFSKQSADYQQVMIELNMADDYFKARDRIASLEQQKHEMEKEIYSLKHELVTGQMKLEAARQELAVCKAAGRGSVDAEALDGSGEDVRDNAGQTDSEEKTDGGEQTERPVSQTSGKNVRRNRR